VLFRSPVAVRLRPSSRARRLTLRVDPGREEAVVTHPPGVPRAELEAFLARQSGWLRRALDARPSQVAVAPGALLPVDGVEVEIATGRCRAPRLGDGALVVAPGRPAGPQVSRWLRARARRRLGALAADYAAKLGRTPAAVAVRDTRSRWGSCSSAGRLSFSWRLAMAPPDIQAYVAAHEAAHLVEMNHSDRYWALLDGLMPGHQAHRAWLRLHGRALHRYDFAPTGG